MTYNKRKKNSRMRGSHTHGWGDKKKRRGHGNRGGKGKAGTGKRGDSKKPSYWHLGRVLERGFKPKNRKDSKAINIGNIELMIRKNRFEKKGDCYNVNLKSLGFTKLLSKGKLNHKAEITVSAATEKAAKKVAEAGGKINQEKKEKGENVSL